MAKWRTENPDQWGYYKATVTVYYDTAEGAFITSVVHGDKENETVIHADYHDRDGAQFLSVKVLNTDSGERHAFCYPTNCVIRWESIVTRQKIVWEDDK